MTEDQIRMLMRKTAAAASLKTAAEAMGISAPYYHDVMNGRRAPGRAVLAYFKLRRVVTYVRDTAA